MDEDILNRDDEGAVGYKERQPLYLAEISATLSAIGTVLIVGLLIVIDIDIISRNFFNAPLRGTPELVTVFIVAAVFLQLPNMIWSGALARTEFVPSAIYASRPRLALFIFAFFHLVGAAVCLLLLVALVPEFQRALAIGDYIGTLGDFTVPLWPVRLVQVIGTGLGALIFVFLSVNNVRNGWK